MYAVVGCGECSALWVLEGRPERSECPRCGRSRAHANRREFLTTDDPDHAREARAAMLAERQGHADAFESLDSFGELDDALAAAGVDDETYLEESGVDTDAVADAAARAEDGTGGGSSRRDTVLAALDALEDPTESDVVAYAAERGVPESFTREALARLVRRGEVTESGGSYRRL